MTLQQIAESFIGQKEIPDNQGFTDPAFQKLMKRTGWRKPLAWCAYFVKACMITAKDAGITFVDMVSPSAVSTFNAYKRAGRVYFNNPLPGDLAVWQKYANGKPTQFGHIAIITGPRPVVGSTVGLFPTVDGNTDEAGTREGDCVARKERPLTFVKRTNGLVLLGFCKTGM
jgi:hypothetical protein